jgi:hypothetical protein
MVVYSANHSAGQVGEIGPPRPIIIKMVVVVECVRVVR